jgi:hypothetical protein
MAHPDATIDRVTETLGLPVVPLSPVIATPAREIATKCIPFVALR